MVERTYNQPARLNPNTGLWGSDEHIPPADQIVISGTGFGVDAPPVVIFADWSNLTPGDTLTNSSANIGTWDSGSYLTGIYSKAIEAHGFTGASLRQGGAIGGVDNLPTGLTKVMPAKKNFLMAHEMAVPAGRYFPGASAVNTLPAVSTFKPVWLSDQGLDEFAKADVVAASWTGANFNFTGNNVPYNMYMSTKFDFDGYNGVICSAVAGANPYADNANLFALFCNADSGTSISSRSDLPAFRYREGYKCQLATTGTLFRVTVNGTNCDYTQQVSDTSSANIATGLKSAIDAQAIAGVSTAPNVGNQVLLDADLRTVFSSTVSANITKVQMLPQYTHIQGPGWSGSAVMDNAQVAYKYLYIAAADDDSVNKRIELLDNANYSLSTMHRVLAIDSANGDYWTDTEIGVTPSATLRSGATHICVTMPNGTQTIEAI